MWAQLFPAGRGTDALADLSETERTAIYRALFEMESESGHKPGQDVIPLLPLSLDMPVILARNLCTELGMAHGSTGRMAGMLYNAERTHPVRPNALLCDAARETLAQPIGLVRLDHPDPNLPRIPGTPPDDPFLKGVIAVAPIDYAPSTAVTGICVYASSHSNPPSPSRFTVSKA